MKRQSNQYSVRLDDELQAEFEACLRITGMEAALLLKESIRAFIAEVRATGCIRFPLAIVPKQQDHFAPRDPAAERRITPPRGPVFPDSPTLNENPADGHAPASPPAPPKPATTRARRALQKMQQREQQKQNRGKKR